MCQSGWRVTEVTQRPGAGLELSLVKSAPRAGFGLAGALARFFNEQNWDAIAYWIHAPARRTGERLPVGRFGKWLFTSGTGKQGEQILRQHGQNLPED